MKKQIAPEDLLRWAYRDELPKAAPVGRFLRPLGFAQPWGAVTKTGVLGTDVQEADVRNVYGLAPDMTAQRDPHPDAKLAWIAVQDLDNLSVSLPVNWNPLADMGELGVKGAAAIDRGLSRVFLPLRSESKVARQITPRKAVVDTVVARVERTLTKPISEIIQTAAILAPPDWHGDKPELRRMTYANGTPRWYRRTMVESENGSFEVEVDGFDKKKRRPYLDAYPKEYLDPDPVDTVQRRGEYRLWFDALAHLVEELRGRLDDHEVVPTSLSAEPWVEDAVPVPRILVDLRKPQPVIGGGARRRVKVMRSAA